MFSTTFINASRSPTSTGVADVLANLYWIFTLSYQACSVGPVIARPPGVRCGGVPNAAGAGGAK